MGWFEDDFVPGFLEGKAKASRDKAKRFIDKGQFKELPVLGKAGTHNDKLHLIKAVAETINQHIRYVPDPWYFDHYTHPEVAWYFQDQAWKWIRQKEKNLGRKMTSTEIRSNFNDFFNRHDVSMDCDDYAALAYALLVKSGFKKSDTELGNLIVPFWLQFSDQIRWNHVICLIKFNKDSMATIDTNGLIWYQKKTRPDLTFDERIMETFEDLYKKARDYAHIVKVGDPFA